MNFKTLIALVVVLAISSFASAKSQTFLSNNGVADSFRKVNDGEVVHIDP